MSERKIIVNSEPDLTTDDSELKKTPFNVPEGYFSNLSSRLSQIPSTSSQASMRVQHRVGTVSVWRKLEPYFALAGCLVIALTIGNFILRKTASPDPESTYENLLYADIIPTTDPYALYGENASSGEVADEVENPSDEDIVNYLIATGTSVEQIEYTKNEKDR